MDKMIKIYVVVALGGEITVESHHFCRLENGHLEFILDNEVIACFKVWDYVILMDVVDDKKK